MQTHKKVNKSAKLLLEYGY